MSKLIRVSDDTHSKLSYIAQKNKRTLSGQIEHMCESVEIVTYPVYEKKGDKVEQTHTDTVYLIHDDFKINDTTRPTEPKVDDKADWGA